MSGEPQWFVGDSMAAVVQGVREVEAILGRAPVVVGGLAVMCRLSNPYRATTDLDVVDRGTAGPAHLEVLRSVPGAVAVEPAAVELATEFGPVRVDVLEVRQAEIDHPSDDPGDRLHAASHAWAHDTRTDVTIRASCRDGRTVEVVAPVAEPGPLIAMKLQALMDRGVDKQGTDLQDLLRLTLDPVAGPTAMGQIASCDAGVAEDLGFHVRKWLVRDRREAVRLLARSGGADLVLDDVDLVAELLLGAVER